MRTTNCTSLLLDANVSAGRGNREALVEAGAGGRRSLTYSELQRAVAGAATFLTRRVPARSGAAVLIAGSATLETVAFWLAVMRTGNVAVLVHPGERGDYYAAVQQDVRPAVWLGDRTSVCPLAERMPPVTDLCQERAALEPGGAGTGALALLSSGSTGRPKVCVHSHAAFFRFHDAVTRPAWGITSGDRILATSGPYFSFGLQGIHVPLSMGATAVLRSSFTTHTDFLETVESEGVTVMLAVPTLYHLLWQRRRRAYDCSRLRLSLSAGERLPDLVRERWESMTGSVMLDSIGTTETFLPFLSERPGDAGGLRPIPAFEYDLRDEDGGTGRRCRLWSMALRSDTMMVGTMRNGRLRPRRRTAWLETGDLVERHGEGFRFAARRRDGFKCSGQWVFPQRLEEALLRIPGVDLSAAVPVETAEGLTRLRAYVVLSGLERRDSEAWLQRADACMRQLRPKALAPESIRIVDSLPVTRTGKLLRRQLEQC